MQEPPIYYGWFVTGACFLGALAIFSVNLSFGVFFEPLLEAFDGSRVDTSVIFSLQTLVLYVSGALGGGLADRYGTRRVMAAGTALFATGLLATTRATTIVEMYLTYGVVTGIGMGLIYVISYSTVSRWFRRRRGLATGIATAGAGIGTFALPPAAHLLLSQYTWQTAYLITTMGMTGLLLVATMFVSDSPRTKGVSTGDEFPDGYHADEVDGGRGGRYRDVFNEVSSGSFVVVFVAFVATFLPVYTLFVHLVVFAGDLGMAKWIGVGAVSLIGGATIPGRVVIGSLGDRLGRKRIFVGSSAAMAGMVIVLPLVSTPEVLVVFSLGYGLIYGGAAALFAPLTVDFFGRDNVNAKFGIMALSLGFGAVIGPVIAGAAYDALGNYTVTFLAIGGFGLLSPTFLLTLSRRTD